MKEESEWEKRLATEILNLYHANPFLIETPEGIARRIGRDIEEIKPVITRLCANCYIEMKSQNSSLICVNHELLSDVTDPLDALRGKLTPREAEVMTLLLDGLTYGDIAERLFISTYTVKNHVNAVYRKLGVTRRAELFSKLGSEINLSSNDDSWE